MRTFLSLVLPGILCGIAAGFLLGRAPQSSSTAISPSPQSFHDLRVNLPHTYIDLIDPEHPEIASQARQFRTMEEAYRFVNEEIRFAPFAPPGPVEKTLSYRTGSCLGKAALLGSFYRAMGMPSENLRLIMGLVVTPQGPVDHVWLDLEHQGQCLQQDPSGMLGSFGFHEFPNNRYVDTYVMKETFCFNDRDFALVSQLNRFRNGTMPALD